MPPRSVEGRRIPLVVTRPQPHAAANASGNCTDSCGTSSCDGGGCPGCAVPPPLFTWVGAMHGDETANRELLASEGWAQMRQRHCLNLGSGLAEGLQVVTSWVWHLAPLVAGRVRVR